MKNNRKYISLLLLGIIIIISVVLYKSVNNTQKQWPARHHLLCEVLRPGMSKEEVLDLLSQVGEYTTREGEWGVNGIEITIIYTDPNGEDLYGHFNLFFQNNEYVFAYIRSFDTYEYICEYPTSTVSGKYTQ
jgi:allophanate hydrolase subunit 1